MRLSPRDALQYDCEEFFRTLAEKRAILIPDQARFRMLSDFLVDFILSDNVKECLSKIEP